MTAESVASAAYLVAALLFILALAGLSRHETARSGNAFGITGMAIALVATLVLALRGGMNTVGLVLLIVAVLIGAVIGLIRASRVAMTGMRSKRKAAAGSTRACWASTTPRSSSACSSAR